MIRAGLVAVEFESAAENVGVTPKTALPEPVTDHDRPRMARLFLFRFEHPPEDGRHVQQLQQPGRHQTERQFARARSSPSRMSPPSSMTSKTFKQR